MTFQQWAELNGRRYIGAASFEEFEKNANDYQAYRNKEELKQREPKNTDQGDK